jgi:DNA-directed RNA polymerase subunit RPC12/RpoP
MKEIRQYNMCPRCGRELNHNWVMIGNPSPPDFILQRIECKCGYKLVYKLKPECIERREEYYA